MEFEKSIKKLKEYAIWRKLYQQVLKSNLMNIDENFFDARLEEQRSHPSDEDSDDDRSCEDTKKSNDYDSEKN